MERLCQLGSHIVGALAPAAPSQQMSPAAAAEAHEAQQLPEAPVEMSQREKFLYDLNGFLVVEDVLSRGEIAALNAAFDANWNRLGYVRGFVYDWAFGRPADANEFRGMCEWPHPHCDPFRELLVPKRLIGHLNTMFGRGWRQSGYVPFMITACNSVRPNGERADPGIGGIIHGAGGVQFHPAMHYRYANDTMRNGLTVFAYQLMDVEEGDGGFCCIPGSHKSNFPLPDHLRDFRQRPAVGPVYNPPAKAGSCKYTPANAHHTKLTTLHQVWTSVWKIYVRLNCHRGRYHLQRGAVARDFTLVAPDQRATVVALSLHRQGDELQRRRLHRRTARLG